MNSKGLAAKLDYYSKIGAIPTILYYGDRIWKRGWLGYHPIAHPNGADVGEAPKPKFKTNIGGYITVSENGTILPGIGAIAANLQEVGGNLLANCNLIFNADAKTEGIAYLDKNGEIMDWISREDVSNI